MGKKALYGLLTLLLARCLLAQVRFDLNLKKIQEEASQLAPCSPWKNQPFLCYLIPALSPIRRLPDALPSDGIIDNKLWLVGAKGEFLTGSFLLAPWKEVRQLEVKASSLTRKNEPGEKTNQIIPAQNVDIRVVKVWWQTGTGWGSYFGDPTRRQLIPELLLHDENLIKVDLEKKENYLRVDYPKASQYVWISAPPEVDDGKFNHHQEPVEDSPHLLSVKLQPGENKQFWLTIKVPEKTVSGIYEGKINLVADSLPAGTIAIQLKVLPFCLPEPRTYYDVKKPFYSFMYNHCSLFTHLAENHGNRPLAEQKLRSELKNMREHNLFQYLQRSVRLFNTQNKEIFVRNLELVKEAGFSPPLFDAFVSSGSFWFPPEQTEIYQQYLKDASEALRLIKKILGHREVYFFGFDEPGRKILLAERQGWKDLEVLGARIFSTARTTSHFPLVGYAEHFVNCPENKRESAEKWHILGHKIASYAVPHTGPENPDLVRRMHGLVLYKANFDGTGNYKYYDQHKIWNDFASYQFRGFNMVYPTRTGVIDTIQWEGFRAGIDDIRYATVLKTLAEKAIASERVEAVYTGKKALIWLEMLDEAKTDLDAARLEMVEYILRLRKLLGEKE
ncbi:MAG: hypothetical protein NC911_01345 [Candidatus Omnitrophica bacterium]|nr:hypothetical protein [Candidatus Omnitrophota bacterium]